MKEATSEVSLLVIVAIAVAILMAFFFGVIWPLIRNDYDRSSNCKNAYCDCSAAKNMEYMCDCYSSKEDFDSKNTNKMFRCPWEG